ncbi:GNAT family N-acetyltransferase [Bdellovibrio sp. NC01]|uniref:GNAT family N-acetyltransferase n=1 Tax=Bdellovibrio sp. NC01 TaxID=2220073 RepID=UPI0011599510|nr:GNAT family N-acetyltransferase [Bdellovibrio sp. NC01]QDK36627.1 GNAT family N-acetyltransferase [Bdellovibrio sp. NC01]
MEGPRSPREAELPQVLDFLNKKLRSEAPWSIAAEYPTAFTANNLHNMRIISDEERVLSHAVMKPLIIKSPHVIFKVGAIGSVVTDDQHRGQGLSTRVINDCLKLATEQSCDIAILWTDLFDFYRKMGFELAGSEISFIIDEEFDVPTSNLRFSTDSKVSPDAIYRLYSSHSVNSVRTIEETRKFLAIPETKVYTAWEANGQLAAYAIEGKGVDLGGYIHEWGGSVSKLMALFSFIRTHKAQPYTIIVPKHATNLIEQLKAKPVMMNQGFLGMIKFVNFDQLAAKIKRAFRAEGVADIVLEKHPDNFVFGCGQDLYTINNETDMVRLLFGPVDYRALGIFKEETVQKFEKVLPLNLWVWGWDSI